MGRGEKGNCVAASFAEWGFGFGGRVMQGFPGRERGKRGLGGPGDEDGAHGFGVFEVELAVAFFEVVGDDLAEEVVFFGAFGEEEHSAGLLPGFVGGLEAVEFGDWEVFDVVGDAHFVEDFYELGSGGKGDSSFAVNVGPEPVGAVLGRVPVEDDEDAFSGVVGELLDELVHSSGGVDDVGAEDDFCGLDFGVFPGGLDEGDVLNVVGSGFLKERAGHGGGGLHGGDVAASEGEGEGESAGAGADVDEGILGLDFTCESVEEGVVGAVGIGAEADGHAVPVVVVGIGLVAESFGLGVFGEDGLEPFLGGFRCGQWCSAFRGVVHPHPNLPPSRREGGRGIQPNPTPPFRPSTGSG